MFQNVLLGSFHGFFWSVQGALRRVLCSPLSRIVVAHRVLRAQRLAGQGLEHDFEGGGGQRRPPPEPRMQKGEARNPVFAAAKKKNIIP